MDHSVAFSGITCHNDATCELGSDGVYGCHCNAGYVGDGIDCQRKLYFCFCYMRYHRYGPFMKKYLF